MRSRSDQIAAVAAAAFLGALAALAVMYLVLIFGDDRIAEF